MGQLGTRRRRAPALPADERRSAIIRATIPLLVEHGEQVTTRQIADAAGIAEGTIFRVFADKDELLAAAVEAALDPAPMEEALAAIDADRPLAEVVAAVVELSQRRLQEVWRILSRVGDRRPARDKPLDESPAMVRLFEAHRAELAVPARQAARMLRGLTLALSHPLLVERPSSPREITRFFLHGAGRDPRC